MSQKKDQGDSDISVLDRDEVKFPSLYKVLMHNDDYTTMEFVIHVLQTYFQKDLKSAQDLMMQIHKKGFAICGVYTLEIAKTKTRQVKNEAKAQKYPLRVTWEVE